MTIVITTLTQGADFDSKQVDADDIRIAEQTLISLRQAYNNSLTQFLKDQHELIRQEDNPFKKKARLALILRVSEEMDKNFNRNKEGDKRTKSSRLKRIK